MIAEIIADDGEVFRMWWQSGSVASDSESAVASACAAYLNGTPTLFLGEPNSCGTDGHYTEERQLRSPDEFLLIVGSLVDLFPVRVQLMGELSDADHEELLNNPEADRQIAEQAIARAVADGMPREQAVAMYGISSDEGV